MRTRMLSIVALLIFHSCVACAAELTKPVKVFILAGQSNMEGQAVADLDGKDYNDGKGTLKFLLKDAKQAPLFKHLVGDNGEWTVRDDVWVHYQMERGPLKAGSLGLGFNPYGKHHFGPELQFGHVLGDHFDNPVLLIKTAWGGKSLFKDFRPPSSGGEVGPYYTKMIAQVRDALTHLKRDFPGYDGGGHELAGFVWYQGWNDGVDPKHAIPEYEQNLVNLIHDVRQEFNAPKLPVVVGELTGAWVNALRQQIMRLLEDQQRMTVTEIYVQLRLEQSVASQHLAILRRAGIVETFRDGKYISYSINAERLAQLNKQVLGIIS